MLGEIHESRQEHELLRKLIVAPGFADKVNDIVVEFGNSRYQGVADRYVAGENVPTEARNSDGSYCYTRSILTGVGQ